MSRKIVNKRRKSQFCGPRAAIIGENALDMFFWEKNGIESNENGMSTYQINKAVLLVTLGNRCG